MKINKYANTFGIYLNSSPIFLWNMSPAGAIPNGNLLYLYLPNWHVNLWGMVVIHLVLGYDNQNSHL